MNNADPMARHQQECMLAKASNSKRRAARRDSIEDELVEGGQSAIDDYKQLLDKRWQNANCLAEYDGLRMGYQILRRAQSRLDSAQSLSH